MSVATKSAASLQWFRPANGSLLPCPFCGRRARMIQPIAGKGQPWNAYCVSGMEGSSNMGCGIVLYGNSGESKESLRARWNQRAGNGRR